MKVGNVGNTLFNIDIAQPNKIFCNWKATLNKNKWKTTSILLGMENDM